MRLLLPDLYGAAQVVEQVQPVLLVPAGVEHGRGAGQLQEPVNHALVLVGGDIHRLPRLGCFVLHVRGVACGEGEGEGEGCGRRRGGGGGAERCVAGRGRRGWEGQRGVWQEEGGGGGRGEVCGRKREEGVGGERCVAGRGRRGWEGRGVWQEEGGGGMSD